MKIGLVDVDGKMPNIALMKISAWHKAQGDSIEWFDPLISRVDKVYGSKLFNFTPDYGYYPDGSVKGGTGYDLKTELPEEIETWTLPDYSIYPTCDYSVQLFSRGCIRECKFCVVPEKEGGIRAVPAMYLNPKGNRIEVLDNNFFANPRWRDAVTCLAEINQPVNMHGVDVRLMTEEHADALNSLRHYKRIHIAWDDPAADLCPKLRKVATWIKPYKLMCYVLIGYGSTQEQDMWRVESLREIGIDPFVMPFDKSKNYQKRFARWVNMKAIFKSVAWKDYNG